MPGRISRIWPVWQGNGVNLDVLVINGDGNIVSIMDEAWKFQFIPIVTGQPMAVGLEKKERDGEDDKKTAGIIQKHETGNTGTGV